MHPTPFLLLVRCFHLPAERGRGSGFVFNYARLLCLGEMRFIYTGRHSDTVAVYIVL